jgi:hypothetical protein
MKVVLIVSALTRKMAIESRSSELVRRCADCVNGGLLGWNVDVWFVGMTSKLLKSKDEPGKAQCAFSRAGGKSVTPIQMCQSGPRISYGLNSYSSQTTIGTAYRDFKYH